MENENKVQAKDVEIDLDKQGNEIAGGQATINVKGNYICNEAEKPDRMDEERPDWLDKEPECPDSAKGDIVIEAMY